MSMENKGLGGPKAEQYSRREMLKFLATAIGVSGCKTLGTERGKKTDETERVRQIEREKDPNIIQVEIPPGDTVAKAYGDFGRAVSSLLNTDRMMTGGGLERTIFGGVGGSREYLYVWSPSQKQFMHDGGAYFETNYYTDTDGKRQRRHEGRTIDVSLERWIETKGITPSELSDIEFREGERGLTILEALRFLSQNPGILKLWADSGSDKIPFMIIGGERLEGRVGANDHAILYPFISFVSYKDRRPDSPLGYMLLQVEMPEHVFRNYESTSFGIPMVKIRE